MEGELMGRGAGSQTPDLAKPWVHTCSSAPSTDADLNPGVREGLWRLRRAWRSHWHHGSSVL